MVPRIVQRQLAHVRAIGPHRVDLPIAIAVGLEGDPGSVRGTRLAPVPRTVSRQSAYVRPIGPHRVDLDADRWLTAVDTLLGKELRLHRYRAIEATCDFASKNLCGLGRAIAKKHSTRLPNHLPSARRPDGRSY